MKWENGQIPNERNFLINMLQDLIVKDEKYYLRVYNFSTSGFGRIYPNKGRSQSLVRRECKFGAYVF